MKPSEAYFFRNRGEWNWEVEFAINNFPGLLRSELSFNHKIRMLAFIFTQKIFGKFWMWTFVDFKKESTRVHHSTKIKKWGITFLRSEKVFILDSNGINLRLEGEEYYWPRVSTSVQFAPLSGSVDASTTRASYQMPLMGIPCDCLAFLELPQGHIEIANAWLSGTFTLTEVSNNQLKSRFQESHQK